ncbi:rod shape-determining protein MreC [Lampropedia cohaerens]|nr:rod shape-determining protein MreC [Lampropedia cohaerens]
MFERRTPNIFAKGPAPLSRLLVYGALAILLMVLDGRFELMGPLRQVVATATYPLQWLVFQPVRAWQAASAYTQDLQTAQRAAQQARREAIALAERVSHVDYLERENERLRGLLELRARVPTRALTAEVSFEAPDPFTNRLVIDKGRIAGVREGAPVLDAQGVLGQVTQVYPFTSEVRVVSDRDLVVPVMNLRTGLRMVAFGQTAARPEAGMEVRYVPTGSDVQEGDMLVTSGIDGYYPPGLPVATVRFVEAHNDTPFLRIFAEPVAQTHSARYVMVLEPVGLQGQAGPELPESGGGGVVQSRDAAPDAVATEETP